VTINELRQMNEFEAENAKLRRMYADLAITPAPIAAGSTAPVRGVYGRCRRPLVR
jgi:hypothetical protein